MKNLYNQTTKIILLCLLAQAFNLLVAYILGDILHLPLFMDTVGTVFIVFYAGLVPGMMVGISYNILRFFLMMILGNPVYPWEIMYCLCGAAIAFFTCFFLLEKSEFLSFKDSHNPLSRFDFACDGFRFEHYRRLD